MNEIKIERCIVTAFDKVAEAIYATTAGEAYVAATANCDALDAETHDNLGFSTHDVVFEATHEDLDVLVAFELGAVLEALGS